MRPFFIGLSISLGFTINPLVMAQNAGPEIQSLIHNFNFSKDDIESLIALLAERGEISVKQAEEALFRLDGLSDNEIHHMTMDALQNVDDESMEFTKRRSSKAPSDEFVTGLSFEFSNQYENQSEDDEFFNEDHLSHKYNKKIQ